jgi:hypothetical protein
LFARHQQDQVLRTGSQTGGVCDIEVESLA